MHRSKLHLQSITLDLCQGRFEGKLLRRLWMIDRRCFYYVFIVVVIRYETTATARWALLFIVRAFFNNTITVAVWTRFHERLLVMLPCFANPAVKEKGRPDARPDPHAASARMIEAMRRAASRRWRILRRGGSAGRDPQVGNL
jgi:hypothetical protein